MSKRHITVKIPMIEGKIIELTPGQFYQGTPDPVMEWVSPLSRVNRGNRWMWYVTSLHYKEAARKMEKLRKLVLESEK